MISILLTLLNFMVKIWGYLSHCSKCTWKEYVLYCHWVKCSLNVNQKSWLIVFFRFSIFLFDVLFTSTIDYCKKSINVSNCKTFLSVFTSCILKLLLGIIHSGLLCLLGELTSLSLYYISIPVNIPCSAVYFIWY